MSQLQSSLVNKAKVGFIGLGVVGLPMALNLARAGQALVVGSRSPQSFGPLRALGAEIADSPAAVFTSASTVILMVAQRCNG